MDSCLANLLGCQGRWRADCLICSNSGNSGREGGGVVTRCAVPDEATSKEFVVRQVAPKFDGECYLFYFFPGGRTIVSVTIGATAMVDFSFPSENQGPSGSKMFDCVAGRQVVQESQCDCPDGASGD